MAERKNADSDVESISAAPFQGAPVVKKQRTVRGPKEIAEATGAEPVAKLRRGPEKHSEKVDEGTSTPLKAKVGDKRSTRDSVKAISKIKVSKNVEQSSAAPGLANDDIADLIQLEEENGKLRKRLADKLRSENAELRKRLDLD